jgi:hypothetical protein
MNRGYKILFGILLLLGGVYAITGASVSTPAFLTRWAATTAGNVTTEGGNISSTNLTSGALTDRWAGFFGNVTGSVYLTDNSGGTTNYLYTWSASDPTAGEVCASEASAFNWASVSTATAAQVNTAWSFGSAPDNATNTFTGSTCNLTFVQGNVNNTADTGTNQGSYVNDTFQTCVVGNTTNNAETDFAFCTLINSTGKNYLGQSADYEIIVPTTYGAGQYETYYFYVEID